MKLIKSWEKIDKTYQQIFKILTVIEFDIHLVTFMRGLPDPKIDYAQGKMNNSVFMKSLIFGLCI